MNTQSHEEFTANWDRQVGCSDQYDRTAADVVGGRRCLNRIRLDPHGASVSAAHRKSPRGAGNQAAVLNLQAPTLMITGRPRQTGGRRSGSRRSTMMLVRARKLFVDLACSSHNAIWERNHLLLFQASLEWLTRTTVKGSAEGTIKIGY